MVLPANSGARQSWSSNLVVPGIRIKQQTGEMETLREEVSQKST